MQNYVMKKNYMNIKNLNTMNFNRLLKFTIKNQHEKELIQQFCKKTIFMTMFFILSQSQAVQNLTIVHNSNINVSVNVNIT